MAGAVLGVVVLVGGDDGGGADPPGAEPSTTTSLPVSPAARDLLERLELGRGRDLHVVLSSEPAGADQGLTVELWRAADGRVRQDLVLAAGGLRTETRTLQLADGAYFCQRATETGFTCQELSSGAGGPAAPSGLVEVAAADLQVSGVTASDTQILGRPARCYALPADPDGAGTVCAGADGTPLRFGVQDRSLTATEVDDDVPDDVFDLPAEPSSPAPASSTSTTAG